jgi:hypothetical protein
LDLNVCGEQVGNNEMEFDLTLEAIVEGDAQALMAQEHLLLEQNQGEVIEKPTVVIDLNALVSLDTDSTNQYENCSNFNGLVVEEDEDVTVVLALQAPPVNFTVDEIQPHELMSAEQYEDCAPNDV